MKKKTKDSETPPTKDTTGKPVKLTYPPEEDIYNREHKVADLNPDDNSKITDKNEEDVMNEKDYDDELTGDDLDVPGSEDDNKLEADGSEDEENNYYSLPDNK